MAIASRPSKVTIPKQSSDCKNLLQFLVTRFPLIDETIWQSRFQQGKIHWLSGEKVKAETALQPGKVLCYYREVPEEPVIPFPHQVLYQDEHILVACKPHFLPVTPGGKYVNECLLERLRQQQNLPDLVPVHRLDRETAGLVIFSVNPETRGNYGQLFADKQIHKTYQAVATLPSEHLKWTLPKSWQVSNRLEKGNPGFVMKEVEGEINAHSVINLVERKEQLGLFKLSPITGKTHQLRLHMMKIGMPILNDKFYPLLEDEKKLDFSSPLQLLAKSLTFRDPISGKQQQFQSGRQLSQWQDNNLDK